MASGPPDAAEISLLSGARLEEMYRTQGSKLRRFLRYRVGEDAAEDMVAEAFLRLANSRKVHLLSEPATYLWRVARNLLFERHRRQLRRKAAEHLPLREETDTGCAPEQEWGLQEADLRRLYQRALDQLPEKTRTVFVLRRVEERSHREIAQELDISTATVEYHMGRALTLIARVLEAADER